MHFRIETAKEIVSRPPTDRYEEGGAQEKKQNNSKLECILASESYKSKTVLSNEDIQDIQSQLGNWERIKSLFGFGEVKAMLRKSASEWRNFDTLPKFISQDDFKKALSTYAPQSQKIIPIIQRISSQELAQQNMGKQTLLTWGLLEGHTEMVLALIEKMNSASLAKYDESRELALNLAIRIRNRDPNRRGDIRITEALIKKMVPKDLAEHAPLSIAAEYGDTEILQMLIKKMDPENLKEQNQYGCIAQALINKMGIGPVRQDELNQLGETALMNACRLENYENIEALIEKTHPTHLMLHDVWGDSALYWLKRKNRYEKNKKLISLIEKKLLQAPFQRFVDLCMEGKILLPDSDITLLQRLLNDLEQPLDAIYTQEAFAHAIVVSTKDYEKAAEYSLEASRLYLEHAQTLIDKPEKYVEIVERAQGAFMAAFRNLSEKQECKLIDKDIKPENAKMLRDCFKKIQELKPDLSKELFGGIEFAQPAPDIVAFFQE